MLSKELFLKEISNFLRSCTIVNKYFANVIADSVVTKYGFNTLPSRFNPYYLHMLGISTIDLKIPKYLLTDDNTFIINPDYSYSAITDIASPFTRVVMVQPSDSTQYTKIASAITCIEQNLGAISFGKYTTDTSGTYTTEYESNLIWILSETDKIAELATKIAAIDDSVSTAISIVTGDITFSNIINSSPLYIGKPTVTAINQLEIIAPYIGKVMLDTVGECSYEYIGSGWVKSTKWDMLLDTIRYYQSIRTFTKEVELSVTKSLNITAPIKCYVITGDLSWDGLYNNGNGIDILKNLPIVKDTDYSEITSSLGYSPANVPAIGTKTNYIRNAYAWKLKSLIVYTNTDAPIVGTELYTDAYLTTKYSAASGSVVTGIESVDNGDDTASVTAISTNDTTIFGRCTAKDFNILHTTYEYTGTDWKALTPMDLFILDFTNKFNTAFAYTDKVSFTCIGNTVDIESLDDKIIFNDNYLVLDEHEYTGCDTPVYIPTYDYKNKITKDFTLYVRLNKEMLSEHAKTATKYYAGSTQYQAVLDKYPSMLDFIKGIFYPVKKVFAELSVKTTTVVGVDVDYALEKDWDTYITTISNAVDSIESNNNFTLIGYDTSLLYSCEAGTMIESLNSILEVVRNRWNVKEFGYEELYYSAVWAVIWNVLPMQLLTRRILNLKTEAAHPYEIWEYLVGKGLDNYMSVMDDRQQLFVYKNINYLRANAGKQSNFEILSDKLLGTYGARAIGKSLLMDVTSMRKRTNSDNMLINNIIEQDEPGIQEVTGLSESVSGKLVVLDEDLSASTIPTETIEGNIASYGEVFSREHNSGLEPIYGSTEAEKLNVALKQHNGIEQYKHTYIPTKLVEITRGKISYDGYDLAVAFTFQTLLRKISGGEIADTCIIPIQFEGLGEPKFFTIGEAIALLFFTMRKHEWFTYKGTDGTQNTDVDKLWTHIAIAENRSNAIANLKTFDTCPKTANSEYDSDCDHSFYIDGETFDQGIPNTAKVWLPYAGRYINYAGAEVTFSVGISKSAMLAKLGNPYIYITGSTLSGFGCRKKLYDIVYPYEYEYAEYLSWNDMCTAEAAGTVPAKYDVYLDENNNEVKVTYKEAKLFDKLANVTISGIIDGSSRPKTDPLYLPAIPITDDVITSHNNLLASINNQVEVFLDHYFMVRGSSDAFFQYGMYYIYNNILVNDVISFSLVPGYKSYLEWFASNTDLKSVFYQIDNGTNPLVSYESVAASIAEALLPSSSLNFSMGSNATTFNTMKKFMQQMCSYNIAFLDSETEKDTIILTHPTTINCSRTTRTETAHIYCDRAIEFMPEGYSNNTRDCTILAEFQPSIGEVSDTCITSLTLATDAIEQAAATTYTRVSGTAALTLYGSRSVVLPVYSTVDTTSSSGITSSGESGGSWSGNNVSGWSNDETELQPINYNETSLVESSAKGVECDDATATLLYGSPAAAALIPRFESSNN